VSGRFPRPERLSGRQEFQAVFQHGTRIERPSIILLWRDSPGARRVGFAVARQVPGAVRRNRARRRLREAYRRARTTVAVTGDLVLVARPPALVAPFGRLVAEVGSALRAVASRVPSR
jgi:ribonuclease P protein component